MFTLFNIHCDNTCHTCNNTFAYSQTCQTEESFSYLTLQKQIWIMVGMFFLIATHFFKYEKIT